MHFQMTLMVALRLQYLVVEVGSGGGGEWWRLGVVEVGSGGGGKGWRWRRVEVASGRGGSGGGKKSEKKGVGEEGRSGTCGDGMEEERIG